MIVHYSMETRKPIAWMCHKQWKAMNKFFDTMNNYMWFFYKPEHDIVRKSREEVKLVFAYFMVGNTIILCYTTSEKPSQAYKIDKNYKQTYEVWKQAKFIRYCTSMDL